MKQVLLLLAILLTGCGLIINGTRAQVPVDSDPQGVEVWVDDVKIGVTPVQVELDRASDHTITFKQPGEEPQVVRVQRLFSGGHLVLDILFTGLIGIVIDAATGAWYMPDPAAVNLVYVGRPQQPAEPAGPPAAAAGPPSNAPGDPRP